MLGYFNICGMQSVIMGPHDAPPWKTLWGIVCVGAAIPPGLADPGCSRLGGLASTPLVPPPEGSVRVFPSRGNTMHSGPLPSEVRTTSRPYVPQQPAHRGAMLPSVALDIQEVPSDPPEPIFENLAPMASLVEQEDITIITHSPGPLSRDVNPAWLCNGILMERMGLDLPNPPLWRRPENSFKAGQLSASYEFWSEVLLPLAPWALAKEPRIRDWILPGRGVDVASFFKPFSGVFMKQNFSSATPPRFAARNHPVTDPVLREFVSGEINKWLLTGAVREVHERPWCCLPLGVSTVRKPRLLFDGRYLNLWIPSPPMQYESLRSFQRGIGLGDGMFSIDHVSGYHHVPISEESRKYLGFCWRRKYYQYGVLPFGWAPACYIYNLLSSVVASFLRLLLVHVIAYLDDFGIAIPSSYSRRRAYRIMWLVWAVMYLAGYSLSEKKCMRTIAHRMILLGFGIDSIHQRYLSTWKMRQPRTVIRIVIRGKRDMEHPE